MGILHSTLFQVARHSNVVVWSQDQAGTFAGEEFPKSLDFAGSGLLLRKHMVESEYQSSCPCLPVRVRQGVVFVPPGRHADRPPQDFP